jgi:FkbM family methyltransferase
MTSPLSIFYYQNHQIYYRPNTVDEEVLAHSFANDIFYTGAPEYEGTKYSIVIDVGGHIGTFSMYSLLSHRASRVIALEPNKESFEILNRNVCENGFLDRITILPYALSDKNGLVKLYLDEENWGHSLTNSNLKRYEEVISVSLSSLFEQQKIEKCDLIKFNCEGAEFQIILSLDPSSLSKIKMMIILFHEDLVRGTDRRTLTRFLEGNGFLTRIDFEGENRGWIIAKNKAFYGSAEHQLIK